MSKVGVSPFRRMSVQELQMFYVCSLNTAKKRMKEISFVLGKRNVSYYDLAKYEGYKVSEVIDFFYPM